MDRSQADWATGRNSPVVLLSLALLDWHLWPGLNCLAGLRTKRTRKARNMKRIEVVINSSSPLSALFLARAALVAVVLGEAPAFSQVDTPPALTIQWTTNQTVQLSWTNTITPFVVETSSFVSDFNLWQPLNPTPALANNQFSLTLDASPFSQFFRLRSRDIT